MLKLAPLHDRWWRPALVLPTLLLAGCSFSLDDDSSDNSTTAPAPQENTVAEAQSVADAESVAGAESLPLEDPTGARPGDVSQGDAALTEELEQLRAEAAEEERRLAEQERLLKERELQLARSEQQEERERLIRERERDLAERERQARVEADRLERERAELEASERRVAEARQELEAETERLQENAPALAVVETPAATSWSAEEDWRDRRLATPTGDDPPLAETEPVPPNAADRLRAGMELEVEILENLSSRDSRVGDVFRTELAADIRDNDGTVVLRAGTQLIGVVSEARPLRQVGGQAALGLEFHELVLDSGERIEIEATFIELGKNQKKDKKKIAGAVIAGAILGRILGDGEAAVVGGLVGAAAGTAAVMKSKGQEVEVPSGTIVRLELTEVITVTTTYGRVLDNRD